MITGRDENCHSRWLHCQSGRLEWDEFAKLGDLEIFDRTAKEQIVARLQGAAIALTNKAVLDRRDVRAAGLAIYRGHGDGL